jgi:energy-coupling factor transporter ATP-binding protein EcfA2
MTTLGVPPSLDVPGRAVDRAQHFVGRRASLARVAAWLDSPPEGNRFLLLTGGPGSGKTALLAWLAGAGSDPSGEADAALRRRVSEAIDAVHFCTAASGGAALSQNPYEFGRHLARQLASRHPDYARLLLQALRVEVHANASVGVNYGEVVAVKVDTINVADPVSLYMQTCEPLRTLCEADPSRQFVVLVDALDEAELAPGDTTIGRLVADSVELPAGVRFLLSTRPVQAVLSRFPTGARWDIVEDARDDADDLTAYVVARCSASAAGPAQRLADRVVQASGGNFLYARTVLDHWLPRLAELASPEELQLPPELDGAYADFLRRDYGASETWGQVVRPLLAPLGVAREPLLASQLRLLVGVGADALQDALTRCQPYLDGQRPDGPFELYHQSFREFLFDRHRNRDFPVDIHDAHADVARRYVDAYAGTWDEVHDDYGLRHTPSHLAQAATTDVPHLRRERVAALLELLGDETFIEAHRRRLADPVALQRDGETAVQRASAGQGEQAVVQLLSALTQLQQLRNRLFDPARAFQLAEEGELTAAERHLAWFGLERRWDQVARLVLAWLGVGRDPAGAHDLLQRVRREEPDDELILLVQELVVHSFGLGPRPDTPDLPGAGEYTVQQIMQRMAGAGGNEEVLLSEVENPSMLGSFVEGLLIGPEGMAADGAAYLGAVDGPHLVGFAALTPEGDRYLEDYLTLQARNSYAFYRTRSLWALLPSITAHPELAWVRRFLRRLVESALAPSSTHFDEQLPLAAVALQVAAGRAEAAGAWEPFVREARAAAGAIARSQPARGELQRGSGDRWGRHKRRLCALAEAVLCAQGDEAAAWSLVELAMALPHGFAGFESPACLALAETAHIVRPAQESAVRAALARAATSAHCCQDPAFCARTTSRQNALALRWWRLGGAAEGTQLDVAAVVQRLVADPAAPEFSAVHVVGERYEGRQPPPVHLPFDERALSASSLRDLSRLYERPLDSFLRVNRDLDVGPDTRLDSGALVNVPDDGMVAQVATFCSAQVLAMAGATRQDRAGLIQQLIPVAVADHTATSTLLARLLLILRPTRDAILGRLPSTLPTIDGPKSYVPDVS